MNFKDLMTKLQSIEENTQAVSEQTVEECGMEMSSPGQTDSVTMSVNMNGSGAGGIKDLMNILKNIEDGAGDAGDKLFGEPASEEEPIMGDIVDAMSQDMEGVEPPQHYGGQGPEGAKFDLYMQQRKDQLAGQKPVGEEFANAAPGSSGPQTQGVKAVTPTGDDLASKGKGALKRNGGENPMQEALVARLTAMYEAKKEKEPEGTYSSKRHETDGQRIARLAREKRQAQNKERMKNDFNAEMEREGVEEGSHFGNEKLAKSKEGRGGERTVIDQDGKGGTKTTTTKLPEKKPKESVNESADILALAKMIRG